ncbi:Ulp1 protease family, C-terminal catalytic domain [Phytophthora cactorum]|nr:Ulp1 protease family, C-terminal catalytic domain [Phytophthora cactorum]
MFHLEWSHLYCARDKWWHNDNVISAFTKTLTDKYSNNTTISCPAYDAEFAGSAEKDLVFMPMNINGNHWVCLVVDKALATIYSYDSFDKRANQNPQAEVADELIKKSLPKAYQVVAVHSPIQKDGYNCGLFVCLYLWRRLCKEAGNDYSTNGLLRRRWEMLRTMVTFGETKPKEMGK